jgi:hypothetical protein
LLSSQHSGSFNIFSGCRNAEFNRHRKQTLEIRFSDLAKTRDALSTKVLKEPKLSSILKVYDEIAKDLQKINSKCFLNNTAILLIYQKCRLKTPLASFRV